MQEGIKSGNVWETCRASIGLFPRQCCATGGPSMSATQLRYPLWQEPFLQAVMETIMVRFNASSFEEPADTV